MKRQAHCRQTVSVHFTIRSEAIINLLCSCCSLKCTESWDVLLLIETDLCLHTVFSVGLQVCVVGLCAEDQCISFRKSLENGWKSKIRSMMAASPHRGETLWQEGWWKRWIFHPSHSVPAFAALFFLGDWYMFYSLSPQLNSWDFKQTNLPFSVWQSPDMESVTEEENSKSHSHGIPSASPHLYFKSLWLRKSYHNMKSAGSGQFVGFTEKFRLRFRGTRWILLACGALTLTRFGIDKFLCLGVSLAPCQTGGGCRDGLNTS